MVEERTLCMGSNSQKMIWTKLVPKKLNIFVWRALKGRFPARVELNIRGVDLDTSLCPCCNDIVESCDYSLISCSMAMRVWEKLYNWWSIAFSISDLFAYCGNVVIPNHSMLLCQEVIWSTGYFIWK